MSHTLEHEIAISYIYDPWRQVNALTFIPPYRRLDGYPDQLRRRCAKRRATARPRVSRELGYCVDWFRTGPVPGRQSVGAAGYAIRIPISRDWRA